MEYLAVALLSIVLGIVYIAIYRLLFHPLASVPGPKLAAITSLHEFYYDCLKDNGGLHAFKMREMHEQYGTSGTTTRPGILCSLTRSGIR
jgi:hypothetical protein